MDTECTWLPAIVPLADSGGDWNAYEEKLYTIFRSDFVDNTPKYGGEPVRTKFHPSLKEKQWTFWHMICEGSIEEDRTPDMRRCERIPWPRPIIEHCAEEGLLIWENERRRGERRVCIWMASENYLVVLARRNGYLLLWTTYLTDREHTRRKLRAEYDAYWR